MSPEIRCGDDNDNCDCDSSSTNNDTQDCSVPISVAASEDPGRADDVGDANDDDDDAASATATPGPQDPLQQRLQADDAAAAGNDACRPATAAQDHPPAAAPQDLHDDDNDKEPQHAAALESERRLRAEAEQNLRRALADLQNLQRRAESDIRARTGEKTDKLLLDFLGIRDDFARASQAPSGDKAHADGLDSILKSMDSLLQRNGVVPIEAIGEIFDPRLHEAVRVIRDPALDDETITAEIRKGYISHEKVLRPTLVEISKKEGTA